LITLLLLEVEVADLMVTMVVTVVAVQVDYAQL
jgi:hypothetical protein